MSMALLLISFEHRHGYVNIDILLLLSLSLSLLSVDHLMFPNDHQSFFHSIAFRGTVGVLC